MRSAITLRRRVIFSVREPAGPAVGAAADGAAAAGAGAAGAATGAGAGAATGRASRPGGRAAAAAAGADAAVVVAPAGRFFASKMSCFVMRPPTPVPRTEARSTPDWDASLRTSGVT